MTEIELTFPHLYEVEDPSELPGAGDFSAPLIFFPPVERRPEHDGLWVKARAENGRTWIGVFAFGYSSPPALSRVISTPDPNRVCVVSKGSAFIVKVDEPEIWEELTVFPVLDVRPALEEQLLIFTDFSSLAAYGSNGLVWQSKRVCWDDLKIVKVTSNTIEGTGFDPTNSTTHESRFVVDLKTGRSYLSGPVSTDGKWIW